MNIKRLALSAFFLLIIVFGVYDFYHLTRQTPAMVYAISVDGESPMTSSMPAASGSTDDLSFIRYGNHAPYQLRLQLRVLASSNQHATVEYSYSYNGNEISHGTFPAGEEVSTDKGGLKLDNHLTLWAYVKPIS